MRRPQVLLAAAMLGGCAHRAPPPYTSEDPLSQTPKAETFYELVVSSAGQPPRKIPVFQALLPEGYRPIDADLNPPVISILVKTIYCGESSITVERYAGTDDPPIEKGSFLRSLSPRPETFLRTHRLRAGDAEAYHGIPVESFSRPLPPADPFADTLGGAPPPRLSIFESRRFPRGGDAYRLYRCRKQGAWGLWADYRAAQGKGRGREFFTALPAEDRRLLGTCFGQTVLSAMQEGSRTQALSKPSMYRLRIMARDEWVHGASRVMDRECLVLRDLPDGFLVLRLRAPSAAFDSEHSAFERFLASFAQADPS
jgi:hypothetical protein